MEERRGRLAEVERCQRIDLDGTKVATDASGNENGLIVTWLRTVGAVCRE
jgi:hypothetical protein